MKIGYACVNNSIGCTSNNTFRLVNYSDKNLIEKVEKNLNCLLKILEWNVKHNIYFFRISSDLVPFASHPICTFNWQNRFEEKFKEIGKFIKENKIRISMHPDQFVLLNALNENIIKKSVSELEYHANVLDLMHLDKTAKIQIHVGGVYGDKKSAKKRFIENYKKLSDDVKKRLVIENDERLFCLKDCLEIYEKVYVPVLLDFFHHSLFNNGESYCEAMELVSKTWKHEDGAPMTDYSSQKNNGRFGAHTDSIELEDFDEKIGDAKKSKIDFDVMLEIKDKEKSCLKLIKKRDESPK